MGNQTPAVREKRTSQELRDASEHLLYELWMLNSLARILDLGAFGNGPVNNALLESFAMHARGLLQFFDSPQNPWPDDMLAEDYFDGPRVWEAVRGDVPPALGTLATRVGKEVAHLTYARLKVTDEIKGWHFMEIGDALGHLAYQFTLHVNPDYLDPGFGVGRPIDP